jgi:hypothetical protein
MHQSQPIPTIINRYTVLDNLQNKFQSPQRNEHVNKVEYQIHSQTKKNENRHNKRQSCERSCSRDMKLPRELGKEFEVSGMAMTGSGLANVTALAHEEIH